MIALLFNFYLVCLCSILSKTNRVSINQLFLELAIQFLLILVFFFQLFQFKKNIKKINLQKDDVVDLNIIHLFCSLVIKNALEFI
jgi:hypothetical protein